MYHRGHLFYFRFKGTCKLFPDFKNFLRDPIWVLLKHFCRSLHLPRCSVRDVNIMTVSEVMTIFVCKGLTRNLEIGNTARNLARMSLIKSYRMLENDFCRF